MRILVAGASGVLGGKIVRALATRGADVVALVRPSSQGAAALKREGVTVIEADHHDQAALTRACEDTRCVVSALSGLRDVLVGAQGALLDAAVAAGCPRFIPSDYALDFTKVPPGNNRNLDIRREFHARLDRAPIAATSILNGMFAELLTGQAPFLLFKIHRALYWESADQPLDFTTMDDVANYTAAAALDPSTPRFLRIAGDVKSARELAAVATEVSGKRFKLLRGGSIRRLELLIRVTRRLAPGHGEVFPPWQGMQYTRDMFSGEGKLAPLDNDRYPDVKWTSVRDVLRAAATARTNKG